MQWLIDNKEWIFSGIGVFILAGIAGFVWNKKHPTNLKLQKENRVLKQAAEIKGKLIYEAPFYWLVDGDKRDGPYCQKCYDDNQKLIRLQLLGKGLWECKTCDNDYTDSDYNEPSSIKKHFDPFDS